MGISDELMNIKPVRTAVRLKDVARILFKYGFDGLAENLGLPGTRLLKKMTRVKGGLTVWRRIRLAFEELGPTYVKFGQSLSFRPDLVPAELLKEFKELREDVRPVAYSQVKQVVEASLGKPIKKLFSEFHRKPVASASMAQVHKAVLHSGETVAVKVQRPGIRWMITSDLDIMEHAGNIIHARMESLQNYDIPGIIREMRKTLLRELDFINEANNMQIFNKNFEKDPDVFAPSVHMELTTEHVLIMDFIDDGKISELKLPHKKRRELVSKGLEAVLKMVLVHGFFHADPHSGNLRIVDGKHLCYMDWGMVGRLSEEMRTTLLDFLFSIVKDDSRKLMKTLVRMSHISPPLLDEQGLQTDLLFSLGKITALPAESADMGVFLLELIETCQTYGIQLRADYIYMVRALAAYEETGREMCPGFDLVGDLEKMASDYLLKRSLFFLSDKSYVNDIEEIFEATINLPRRMTRFLNVVEAGKLRVDIGHKNLEGLLRNIRHATNRMSIAIIIVGLLIGSSLIIASGVSVPYLGETGFIISGVLGVWLILGTLFRGKD